MGGPFRPLSGMRGDLGVSWIQCEISLRYRSIADILMGQYKLKKPRHSVEHIDHLLYLQLIVACLGEKELAGWWDTDIAYRLGGAGFLARIAGSDMAPLAAGDGVLLAARTKEGPLVGAIPGTPCMSLFCPPASLGNELNRRFIHYKKYREDTPEEVFALLNPQTDWTVEALRELLKKETAGAVWEAEGTTAGRELTLPGERPFASGEEALRACAAAYLELAEGGFTLVYCRTPA